MDFDSFVILLLLPICVILAAVASVVWLALFGPVIVAEKLAVKMNKKTKGGN